MANETLLRGNCLAPFYDASAFPSDGGSEWLNVVGLILCSFMLVSYTVLPAQKTRSHYLSVCLIVSVMMIALGFTIPLSAKPEQCYNQITPNDMYSNAECAWSGAFIIAGGLSATMWIFIRALSMNLQICFDIVPGRKFFYLSQALGWGIPAALFTATMTVTGVSFRMGNACHVNHETSMQDFWGPLLGLAGAAGIVQVVTFAYCVHVYLKNLWTDQAQSSTHGSSSGLPSYNGSVRTQTAHAVYRRLKKVLWLQWRGICIITIILVDVIFFSIVFVYLDGLQSSLTSDWHGIEPWLECLAFNPTNKDKCLGLVTGWLVNESTVVAVLLLLSLTGVQVFIFLARPSIFPAWYDFVQDKLSSKRQEFVSLDARPNNMRSQSGSQLAKYDHVRGHQSTTFEMQKPQLNSLAIDLGSKSPTHTMLSSPSETYRSPIHHDLDIAELDSRRSISPPIGGLGRGRHAPEYVGRVTPDLGNNPLASPSPPPVSYNSISLHRPPSDYFDPHRPQQQRRAYTREASTESLPGYSGRFSPSSASSPPQRRESHERRYQAPVASFSAPKTPSRQSSTKSVAFAPTEAKEVYGRGGLALNPPSEAGESQEDLTGRGGGGFGLDRR
ncbi:hypothetical protein LTR74_015645 [Friedmanniomyces endolithicus]|nr:hypothetical protein LTR74_015645 [Friedmanniomyces endolithicus]